MCLAIPAQIVELQEEGMARVRVGESQTFLTASVMLLPEPPQIGDYVILHAGFALHTMTPQEAQDSLAALRELAEAMEGTPAPFEPGLTLGIIILNVGAAFSLSLLSSSVRRHSRQRLTLVADVSSRSRRSNFKVKLLRDRLSAQCMPTSPRPRRPQKSGLLDFRALFAHTRAIFLSPASSSALGPGTAAGSQHE